MRKLVYAINTSLDGYCDHTHFYPDEDLMRHFTQLTREAGTFLYGRKTYELMIPYWPDVAKTPPGKDDRDVDIEYARAFDAVEKIVVFSRSLNSVEGEKTRIVNTGLRDEVLKLKQQPGKNIFTGGVNLAAQLAALGLIDEYHLVVHPIVAGRGTRLFEGISLQEKLKLKLVESTVFKSGAVALRYLKQ
ncbi:MAG TPA: dihydrofolate reductase family protein [Mucilaginibacter sp.]|jgi:dihydrofolate reductase|nr:dihydrofolate reductase family protein [Mucilaginibacter sp.]